MTSGQVRFLIQPGVISLARCLYAQKLSSFQPSSPFFFYQKQITQLSPLLSSCITQSSILRFLMICNMKTGGQKGCSNSSWIVFHSNCLIIFLGMLTSQCRGGDFLFSVAIFHQNDFKTLDVQFIPNTTMEAKCC